jgi:mRNA interferase RelE/StbE
MTSSDERYDLELSRSVKRALSEDLPQRIALVILVFLTTNLIDDPHRVGKRLKPPLEPAYSARRGSYRILYFIDDEARVVTVASVAHRSDAYAPR